MSQGAPATPRAERGRAALARDLVTLYADYGRRLPGRVRDLDRAVRTARRADTAEAISAARPLFHRLHGTAASFGFGAVGAAAGRVDVALACLDAAGAAERGAIWSTVERNLDDVRAAVEVALAEAARDPAAPEQGVASPRILVVDGDAGYLGHVAALGLGLLVEVECVKDEAEALARARAAPPDAAFLDAGAAGSAGLARRLRELPGCQSMPLAFVSSRDDLERRITAAHAGASLFLPKPLDADTFGLAVHQLTAALQAGRPHVLVVDDDRAFCEWVAAVLRGAGIRATMLCEPASVLLVLGRERPDLVLLDTVMPDLGGLDVCRLLRAEPRWQELPILCLTADAAPESRVAAFEAGADDFLAKPVLAAELLSRVKVRIDRARLRRERAEKDALTGLLLRRGFLEQVGARVAEAQREHRVLSVGLLDLDNFKRVNDEHGHLAGDRVLAALGHLIALRFRAEDVRARWGGEEFAVAFPGQPPRTVAAVLGRILAELGAMEFRGDGGELFHEEFSAGVASFPADGTNLESLLRAADRRLYRAKNAGRGRVEVEDR